jgi:nucleoside-diphosphate-sugar epimerase/predicted dehydrogenase
MKVAIVGAGNNADYHVRFGQSYDGARIVGIADTDLARAEEYVRRYGVERAYASTSERLNQARPDVVHVVTPPRTHYAVVREVLEAGCHVLVEKPLALNLEEAQALYDLAERRAVQICPIHNHLFDPCMRRADALIKQGRLGRVVNVESYYGLNTDFPAFREYPKPNVLPWLYGLPGGVYQDFLPHPLYLLLEYTGAPRTITVTHRATGVLPQALPDEIRILVDGEHAMGIVTVSFAAKPHLHFVRVFGTNGMVEADINTMTTTVHAVSSLPKAAQKATFNLDDGLQKTRSTFVNTFQFLTGKLKPYHGMMNLIHAFYDAVGSGTPPPVSKDSALAVVRTMDRVFEQLKYEPLRHERLAPVLRKQPAGPRVLVTGGTGFLGKALVRRLVADGYRVRVLARKLAQVDAVHDLGAEVCWGDVADVESFDQAMSGCDRVVHLAAGTSGSERDSQTATLQGTRNLLELCGRHSPKRLVYISSCSVYGVADYPAGALVTEASTLERFPERRGSYSASKQEAETYVSDFVKAGGVPTVILRPGTIYGPGGELYTPLIGFSIGSTYIVIGTGATVLPFVYVDNLVDAVVLSLEKDEAVGEVFNVVDPERLDKRTYMNQVIRRANAGARVVYFPYSLLYGITWMQERAFALMKRRPVLSCYRLTSSQKSLLYDSSRLAGRLGWKAKVSLVEAMDRLVQSEASRRDGAEAVARASTSGVVPPIAGSHRPAETDSAG